MQTKLFPDCGSVLGVDVGFSLKKRSSAVCRLDWTSAGVSWTIERFCADDLERKATLRRVADRPLLAAAFDGPLRRGFDEIGQYRVAERMLTRGLQPFIGKPGQSSAPVGRKLNRTANLCAQIVLESQNVGASKHAQAIDDKAIVEAFPSSFLGVLVERPMELTCRRGNRSDLYYTHLTETGCLQLMFEHLLPGRRLALPLRLVTNHDDRAGLVCALTALCIAAGDYVAVGDEQGFIILPPRDLIQPWAWSLLEQNAPQNGSLFSSPRLHRT